MPKTIIIPSNDDLWDPESNMFVSMKEQKIIIEHSLISLSKWERITKKPFLSNVDKLTNEEWLLYIKCMTLNNVNEIAYRCIDIAILEDVITYINDPMSATTITDLRPKKGKKEILTSELIYYIMISYGIPIELEKWHLNNLITLISVFSIKNDKGKKMSPHEAGQYQRALNASRRKKRH